MPVFGGIVLFARHLLDDTAACIDSDRLVGMEQACKVFRYPFHRLSITYDNTGGRIAVRIEPGSCNRSVYHIIFEFLCGITGILDADRSLFAEVPLSDQESAPARVNRLAGAASNQLCLIPVTRHRSAAPAGIHGSIWISDTAAYFAGRALGKHKLAPNISPGKTWEGVAGAVVAVSIYALIWARVAGEAGHTKFLMPLLLILAIMGIIGDLFESLIKRHAGLKDSGNILPGHGGILDRIDALTSTLPIAVLPLLFLQSEL